MTLMPAILLRIRIKYLNSLIFLIKLFNFLLAAMKSTYTGKTLIWVSMTCHKISKCQLLRFPVLTEKLHTSEQDFFSVSALLFGVTSFLLWDHSVYLVVSLLSKQQPPILWFNSQNYFQGSRRYTSTCESTYLGTKIWL